MRKQEGKIEQWKKGQKRICVRNITFLPARPLPMSFLLLFSSTVSLLSCLVLGRKKLFFAPETGGGSWKTVFQG